MIRFCNYCGNRFITYPCEIKIGKGRYCSQSCFAKDRKGIFAAHWQGGKPKCKVCGKQIYYKNTHCVLHSNKLKSGKNHYNWKGGITPLNKKLRNSIEYKLWREAIFKRDNWTCQKCGKRGVYLQADHIKPLSLFPELSLDLDNGRALCTKCHKKTDTFTGKITTLRKKMFLIN